MMHRFVAVVTTAPHAPSHAAIKASLGLRGANWSPVLQTAAASAWVFSAAPSRLGARAAGDFGCVIGVDFPADGAAEDGDAHTPQTMIARRWGAYVAIHVAPDQRTVSVVRDPTGRIECYRLACDGFDVLFSHYEDVYTLNRATDLIDWDYIAYHLNNDWLRGAATGLRAAREILPGEQVTYSPEGFTSRLLWTAGAIAERPFEDIETARREIRAASETAIGRWAGRYERIALDLSGGLDSAIVLGLLRQHAGHANVVGINYVTAHSESDERRFAHDAARLHGIELIEQEVSPDAVGQDARFALRLLRPTVRLMSLGYDEVGERLAKTLAADAHFTGTGGDHLFFDNASINALADFRRLRGFGRDFVGAAHQLATVSRNTIWSAFARAGADMAGRTRSLESLLKVRNPLLAGDALAFKDYERFSHPWVLLAMGSTPPEKLRQIVNIIELQRHYWRYGRADVAEEVHPLFAQPLVEACLRTPAFWFPAGGVQRGLARQIFADLLPESIRGRRSKSANTSHRVQMLLRRLPQIRELLLEGELQSRGLLDRPLLEDALKPLALAEGLTTWPLVIALTTEMWIRQMMDDHSLSRPRPLAAAI